MGLWVLWRTLQEQQELRAKHALEMTHVEARVKATLAKKDEAMQVGPACRCCCAHSAGDGACGFQTPKQITFASRHGRATWSVLMLGAKGRASKPLQSHLHPAGAA